MIKVKAIITDNGASPESNCELKFGNYFDGVNFNYFESVEEKQEWDLLNNSNSDHVPEPKTDLSNIDIDSLTDEQMIKIANRLKVLLG